MLLNKTTQDIIRVLLNEKDKKLTLRELAAKAKVSLGMAVRIVGALESCRQVEKRRGIYVTSIPKMLKGWAYTTSLYENVKLEFLAPERPQYLLKKISNILQKETYAFTLFSATEIVAPYVAPNKLHLYISKGAEQKVSKLFGKNGIIPAEEGNIVCYVVDESHFYGSKEIRGVKVISFPQLYVDLISYGGRGEEAAEYVLKLIEGKNV